MLTSELKSNGFAVIPNVLDPVTVDRLIDQLSQLPLSNATKRRGQSYFGIRNLLTLSTVVEELALSKSIREIVEQVDGQHARVVKGIFFDKTPEANWKVVWHQDLTIAVRSRKEVDGFKCWSVKAGLNHVQPPSSVMETMITLRLHLDDTSEHNGALKVIPGSHRYGRLSADKIRKLQRETAAVSCTVGKGGALIMRPLLLHSSTVSNGSHRRVVHLEYASVELPGGLEWHCA